MKIMNKFFTLLVLAGLTLPANAAFGNLSLSGQISCNNPSITAQLDFITGAPAGTYAALFTLIGLDDFSNVTVDGEATDANGYSKEFEIPKDEDDGLSVNFAYDIGALKAMGDFGSMEIPLEVTPGNDLTDSTGFGKSTATLVITDAGCADDGGETPPASNPLEEAIDEAEANSFESINVNDLVTAEQDLKVNFTYKIPTALYQTIVGELKEGENITDKAKELAKDFGLKLDLKRLKKEAGKQLRKATKGLKGEEKKAAEAEARKTGFLKLLDEVRLKLPKIKEAKDKEAAKKIRKAKKKKIFDALEVTVKEVTENAETGKTCLSFVITLPAKVCAKDDGSKALVIAGQQVTLMNLEPGEEFSIDLPVQVKGFFQQFFGVETAARKRKGKKGPNGKTNITLTLTNPISE